MAIHNVRWSAECKHNVAQCGQEARSRIGTSEISQYHPVFVFGLAQPIVLECIVNCPKMLLRL